MNNNFNNLAHYDEIISWTHDLIAAFNLESSSSWTVDDDDKYHALKELLKRSTINKLSTKMNDLRIKNEKIAESISRLELQITELRETMQSNAIERIKLTKRLSTLKQDDKDEM